MRNNAANLCTHSSSCCIQNTTIIQCVVNIYRVCNFYLNLRKKQIKADLYILFDTFHLVDQLLVSLFDNFILFDKTNRTTDHSIAYTRPNHFWVIRWGFLDLVWSFCYTSMETERLFSMPVCLHAELKTDTPCIFWIIPLSINCWFSFNLILILIFFLCFVLCVVLFFIYFSCFFPNQHTF